MAKRSKSGRNRILENIFVIILALLVILGVASLVCGFIWEALFQGQLTEDLKIYETFEEIPEAWVNIARKSDEYKPYIYSLRHIHIGGCFFLVAGTSTLTYLLGVRQK